MGTNIKFLVKFKIENMKHVKIIFWIKIQILKYSLKKKKIETLQKETKIKQCQTDYIKLSLKKSF